MNLIKNIKVGIASFLKFIIIFVTTISSLNSAEESNFLLGNFVEIKILDKVSSKNELLKIKIGKNNLQKYSKIKYKRVYHNQ